MGGGEQTLRERKQVVSDKSHSSNKNRDSEVYFLHRRRPAAQKEAVRGLDHGGTAVMAAAVGFRFKMDDSYESSIGYRKADAPSDG